MDIESVVKLMQAVKETGYDHFEIVEGDFAMKLERNKPPQAVYAAPHNAAHPDGGMPAQAPPPAQPADEGDGPAAAPEGRDIVSPLVGVFHELAEAKAVKIGDKLKKGDAVCMIEAMKLMNEINMPEDGEIVWVAASEGDTVEYEQLLFRYV